MSCEQINLNINHLPQDNSFDMRFIISKMSMDGSSGLESATVLPGGIVFSIIIIVY